MTLLQQHMLVLTIGFLLDLTLGDPQGWPHLVRFFGNRITSAEGFLRHLLPKQKAGELFGGVLLVLWLLVISGGLVGMLLWMAYRLHFAVGILTESLLCWQCLAMKSLKTESGKVYDALVTGTLEDARHAVSMIVGRDTQRLDATGVTKAAVETVAENTSDGVLAPMFWIILLGGLGGSMYKAINTMDSMIGYRNEKYQYFGRVAAKLDDGVNFIPARLSGVLLVLAAGRKGFDMQNSWRIFLRDRKKHASPNSAHGEAAVAGALHVRLAGDAWYFGELHKKPFIGDNDRPVVPEDIQNAHRLLYGAGVEMLGLGYLLMLMQWVM